MPHILMSPPSVTVWKLYQFISVTHMEQTSQADKKFLWKYQRFCIWHLLLSIEAEEMRFIQFAYRIKNKILEQAGFVVDGGMKCELL